MRVARVDDDIVDPCGWRGTHRIRKRRDHGARQRRRRRASRPRHRRWTAIHDRAERAGWTSTPGPAAPSQPSCTPSVEPAALDVPATASVPQCGPRRSDPDALDGGEQRSRGFHSPRRRAAVVKRGFSSRSAANTRNRRQNGQSYGGGTEGHDPTARCDAGAAVHVHRWILRPGRFPPAAARAPSTVATRGDCAWTVSDDAANGLPLLPNPGRATPPCATPSSRTARPLRESATIRIGGRTHRVTQAAAAAVCSLLARSAVADRERGRRRGALPRR